MEVGRLLLKQGHEVFGVRRISSGQSELVVAGIKPLLLDLTNPEALRQIPGRFDWVVNTAAAGRGGGLSEYQQVYLEGTRRIVEWLEAAPPRKYVYTSSTGVYAQNDGSWVNETSPTEPANPTSQVLVQTEQLLLSAWREDQVPAVILRVAGIYGPGRGYALNQYLTGQARLEGRGERIMNMIHRDDVAGGIVAALERGRPGEIYNAVDEEPVTQADFYAWLSQKLGKPMPPSAPADETVARQRGVTNKRISNQKLKAELNYVFKYPTFREGLIIR